MTIYGAKPDQTQPVEIRSLAEAVWMTRPKASISIDIPEEADSSWWMYVVFEDRFRLVSSSPSEGYSLFDGEATEAKPLLICAAADQLLASLIS